MSQAAVQSDPILCRCLQVRLSTVNDCVVLLGAETTLEVRDACGAGAGCMACVRRIKNLIEEHRSREAGQPHDRCSTH
ncbi:(2Fe-2S)-binding protein [Planctomicrobium sp. SH664]|uniref:(2Fe-2S)-binding protein n=1 Tax=Planctomicrobium sp. SH664 TaxID=3448125 RepID=UPI003F5BBEFF